jgi:Holliday junction resolvase-like predicted endonuclease
MINEFDHLFENTESCRTEIVDKHTFVYEDEISKKGVFVQDNEVYHVHIENLRKESFHFIQNDDCVMKSIKGGQCDYVVFNNENIHFVEVKATNQNLKTHKQKLYKQLENTFKYYKGFTEKFETKHALVCFESINPRGYVKRKIPQSSNSEKKVLFKMLYNIELVEGNYIKLE